MKTIVIAVRKGGSGKTTTTHNIAVALAKRGSKVLLLDTDSQGSLTSWWHLRKATDVDLAKVSYEQLQDAITAASAAYDYTLIDTPPEHNDAVKATVALADFVLIPAKASPKDLSVIGQTYKLVKELDKPYAILLNEVKSVAKITREMLEAYSQLGPLAPTQGNRTAHTVAPINGLTCIDTEPNSKASDEVNALTDYIVRRLENLND